MTELLGKLAILAIMWAVTAWVLMLAVGIAHIEWIAKLPTIGFRTSLLISSLVMARAAMFTVLGMMSKDGKS